MAKHYVHETVRITGTFTDSSGAAADPSDVIMCIVDPSGNSTKYTYSLAEITKSSTGIYYLDILSDESGTWTAWVKGTGSVYTIEKRTFTVHESTSCLAL